METRGSERSTMRLVRFGKDDDSQTDELSMTVNRRVGIGEILARQAMAWCRCWLEMFPVRMTLNNVGLLTVFLAIMSPRSLIYRLVYPIFRLVFGTLYPAYASYKAVRTKNVKEYVKWMMYWIVFALFTCAETFTDVFFSFWFPFYYEIKIILVLWLLSPATKGSSILYRRFVHPALIRREAEIDEALARATEQGYTAVLHLGTKGVNYATTVLMQTAIKGGGGLVQQLRKSYSLSDLTGEKEDENRNTPDARDETDTEGEPRRRENAGRRGYSPRRTQSSSNTPRMDMYFSEVDVDTRQQRPRETIANLTNIRSSDDVSSGYSSGEALQTQRVTNPGDSLTRTSSVGARTRTKPRSSTTKKTPEDRSEDFERIDLPFPESQVSLPSSLNVLTAEQAVELLRLFARSDKSGSDPPRPTLEFITTGSERSAMRLEDVDEESPSSAESGGEFVDADAQSVQTIEIKHISMENLLVSRNADKTDAGKMCSSDSADRQEDEPDRVGEICREKIDELKQLLDDAHRAVVNIVSSQEKLDTIGEGKERDASVSGRRVGSSQLRSAAPSCESGGGVEDDDDDDDNRAGKYHKKPAPSAPLSKEAANVDTDGHQEDEESQNALKATLVIKTGTLRTVANPDATRDIFLARTPDPTKRKKKSKRSRAKEGFTKLLTIPRNMFHNAFHKEQSEDSSKEEDSSSTFSGTSERSASRSGSIGSHVFMDAKLSASRQELNVEEIPLRAERQAGAGNAGGNIDDSSVEKTGNDEGEDVAGRNTRNSEDRARNVASGSSFETVSRPPRDARKKEIVTDIN